MIAIAVTDNQQGLHDFMPGTGKIDRPAAAL